MNKAYTNEKELLILLSRVTFFEEDIKRIERICAEKISWCELFKYAMKNKVVGLVWSNINKLNIRHVPKYLRQIFEFMAVGQRYHNALYLEERDKILKKFQKEGIAILPVKGAMLVEQLYSDLSQRSLGDLDFLIMRSDEMRITAAMSELGYQKGNYDAVQNEIIPVPRAEDISWKIGATNFYPFLKKANDSWCRFYKIDFRHSVGDKIDSKPIEEILSTYMASGEVQHAHIIAHLALHLYHEAQHAMSVLYNKDINIIKFCDIREYCIKYMQEDVVEDLVLFVKKHGMEEAIYYTFFYLDELYHDNYAQEVLKHIMTNEDVLNYYYNDETKCYVKWKQDFFDRMFAADNFSEVEAIEYDPEKSF